MHRALIHHPQRTQTPADASLFFVPNYVALSLYERGEGWCGGVDHQGRMSGVVEALRTSPWFQVRMLILWKRFQVRTPILGSELN